MSLCSEPFSRIPFLGPVSLLTLFFVTSLGNEIDAAAVSWPFRWKMPPLDAA